MTVRDHMTLRLAAASYRYPAVRENHAIDLVGLRPTAFWAAVNRLLDDPRALATYPMEVGRLRRLRAARRAARMVTRSAR